MDELDLGLWSVLIVRWWSVHVRFLLPIFFFRITNLHVHCSAFGVHAVRRRVADDSPPIHFCDCFLRSVIIDPNLRDYQLIIGASLSCMACERFGRVVHHFTFPCKLNLPLFIQRHQTEGEPRRKEPFSLSMSPCTGRATTSLKPLNYLNI